MIIIEFGIFLIKHLFGDNYMWPFNRKYKAFCDNDILVESID